MTCELLLDLVPGATHLFEEPGTLEHVADSARRWFERYLQSDRAPADAPIRAATG
jgi:hypothetical protein